MLFQALSHHSPITSTSPAKEYVGIDQSISYGGSTILATTAGIVDTGTTLTLIASGMYNRSLTRIHSLIIYLSDALAKYQSATGAVSDNATGLLRVTAAQFAALQSLNYKIGTVGFFQYKELPYSDPVVQTTYQFTPNAQIWPRSVRFTILLLYHRI